MNYCAHIFIGAEFSKILPSISEYVLRTGDKLISCANLYLIDGIKLIECKCSETPEIDIIKGNVDVALQEIGEIQLSDVSSASSFLEENIYDKIVFSGRGDMLYIQIHFPLYKADALDSAIALNYETKNNKKNIESANFAIVTIESFIKKQKREILFVMLTIYKK